MLAEYYTIASGMLAQQRRLEVQSNNLVNSQTPGYHAQRVITSSFEEELARRLEPGASAIIGTANPMTIVEQLETLFQSGDVKDTGRNMDVAINGQGYFNIQGDDGQLYLTRNGSFDVDEEGYLILEGVGRVQGENGNLLVGDTGFTIYADGTVLNSDGNTVGNLMVTEFPENPIQYNNGMFGAEDGAQTNQVENVSFIQGSLELSNVDLNREYSMVIEAQRSFQACSSALQIIDDIDQKAASQIASI